MADTEHNPACPAERLGELLTEAADAAADRLERVADKLDAVAAFTAELCSELGA